MSAAANPSGETRRMSRINPNAPACKGNGDTCVQPAIAGGEVCRSHGGSAPQVRAAAKRRLAIAKADEALADLEYEPIGDPVEELADVAGQAKAVMAWTAARLSSLQNELDYRDENGVEQLKVVVALYERAMERTAKMLAALAKLGLEERRVAVEAAKVTLVAQALRMALSDAGVAEPQPIIEAFAVRILELEKANSEAPNKA